MIAIVLAGGLGTRLRPVVPEGPKCMGPVAGRPFLEHLVDALRGQGLRQFVFAIGYGGASIRAHFGTGVPFGVEASYSDDGDRLRGTGGALARAVRTVSGPPGELILVANGDTWVDVDLRALEDAHGRRRALVTILAVRTNPGSGGPRLSLPPTMQCAATAMPRRGPGFSALGYISRRGTSSSASCPHRASPP